MTNSKHSVSHLTTYAHVADIEASIEFYAHLGFACVSDWDYQGKRVWAHLQSQQAQLMISVASHPIDAGQQAVLFYCHAEDVKGLRQQLIDSGIGVSEVNYPEHMTSGEIRVVDPDGYVILIGQLEPLDG